MSKRVLDVGNCVPDHAAIKALLQAHFDCQVVPCDGPEQTLAELDAGQVDLILVNRKLDRDYSDGIEIIRQLKQDPQRADIPMMLITNYAEHQDRAEALGAARGFGKLEFDKPQTIQRLARYLS
jgi:CheY-like chemotaxis protein